MGAMAVSPPPRLTQHTSQRPWELPIRLAKEKRRAFFVARADFVHASPFPRRVACPAAMSLSALSELLSPNRAGEASSDRGAYVPWVRTPSLPVALAVFALFLALELLQRWSVLRPVRFCPLWTRSGCGPT